MTYKPFVRYMRELAERPIRQVKDMKGSRYDSWLFARDSSLVQVDQGYVELTKLGSDFAQSDDERRRAIFRSIVLRNDQFSAIWSKVESAAVRQNNSIAKSQILQFVKEVTGTSSSKMSDIYTNRFVNWAKYAGLLRKLPGTRPATYKIKERSKFGEIASVGGEEIEAPLRETRQVVPVLEIENYLSQAYILVSDLLLDPDDLTHQNDLRVLMAKWEQDQKPSEVPADLRRIVVNEINYALEKKDLDAYRMTAKTLKIMRSMRSHRKTLEEFT